MTHPLRDVIPSPATPSDTRIGWIGTGVMGSPMCHHLQEAQYRVTIFTRNRSKASYVLAKGATWADSPAAVAEQSDVVLTMVGFPSDVREVYFGRTGASDCRTAGDGSGRYDHDGAVTGARTLPLRSNAGSLCRRCTGLRRGCRRAQCHPLHHGRWRHQSGPGDHAVARTPGQKDRPSRRLPGRANMPSSAIKSSSPAP